MNNFVISGSLALALHFCSASAATACDPSDFAFVCGLNNAEDLVHLRGTSWIVASQLNMDFGSGNPPDRIDFNFGPLQAVRIDTHEVLRLYPAPDSTVDWDRETYPQCRTPPQKLTSGGLHARRLGKNTFRVYAVNHGDRQSVEVIDVVARDSSLHATWRGCILAPRKELETSPNSVAPLPDGGLILSGGNLAIWRPGLEWQRLKNWRGLKPGKYDENAMGRNANGVEVSPDGRFIFVANDSAERSVMRVPLHGNAEPEARIGVNFYPDNLRWGEDGKLYAAGPDWVEGFSLWDCLRQTICDVGFAIAQIDPVSLMAKEVFRSDKRGIKGKFGAVTVALQAGGHLWIGTVRGDRVMVVPLNTEAR